MHLYQISENRADIIKAWAVTPLRITNAIFNECTSVGVSLENKIILAKNRDRTYYPKLKIIRELINNIETCYMYDVDTDYSEGMNEKHIGIVNTTLQGKEDEKERKTVTKFKKLSADGHKIRTALCYSDIDKIIKSLDLYKRGLGGHTTVGHKNGFVSIEKLRMGKPNIIMHEKNDMVVRANHGVAYPDQGYQHGQDRESSLSRVFHATKDAKLAKTPEDLLELMRKHNSPGYLEPYRTNYKVWTSSQILMNLTDLVLTFVVDENAEFIGIEDRLPNGYKPKIKIELYESELVIKTKKIK